MISCALTSHFAPCFLISSLTLAIKDIQIVNNEYAARGYASKEGPTESPSLHIYTQIRLRTNWLWTAGILMTLHLRLKSLIIIEQSTVV